MSFITKTADDGPADAKTTQRLITAGKRAPQKLLDKVLQGDVNAACAAQMLCTTAHTPWVQTAGIAALSSAFATAVKSHACDANNERTRSLFTFCLCGLGNAWYFVGESFTSALQKLFSQYVMPTIALALQHWDQLEPRPEQKDIVDGRLHFFMLVGNVVKPHTLNQFAASPFVQIAPLALSMFVLDDEAFKRAISGAPPEQTRLILVNVIHRLVDLEEVQLALWEQRQAELAQLVTILDANHDQNVSMDLLDILIELGKARGGDCTDYLWYLPGLVSLLVRLARRTAFSRKEGYGDPENKASSRRLALGCLYNMCHARRHLKLAWKEGVLDAALIGLRGGDEELRSIGSDLVVILGENLDGARKHGVGPATRALLEQACALGSLIPKETRKAIARMKQVLETFQDVSESGAPAMLHACHTCSKAETAEQPFQSCSRCKRTYYCSRECQVKDWPHHKAGCKKIVAAVAEESMPKTASKSVEILSSRFFNENYLWLVSTAKARRIPLPEIVFYVDFENLQRNLPRTQMFRESKAADALKDYAWWEQGKPILDQYCAKRRECCKAGDSRLQFVHICTFEGGQLYGGRYIMPEEHSSKLAEYFKSKEGKGMAERMMIHEARRGIEALVGKFEQDGMIGPVTIHGLLSRPELNGKKAHAEAFDDETGRYRVRLDDSTFIMVKPERLTNRKGEVGTPLRGDGSCSMYDDCLSPFAKEWRADGDLLPDDEDEGEEEDEGEDEEEEEEEEDDDDDDDDDDKSSTIHDLD